MLTSSSFKLKKLNNSMQLRTNILSKDITTPRIGGLNSLSKSIKYNNISFITGQQLCKLRRQPQQTLQDPEYLNAHENMASIRKKFDKVNQQKLYYQNKIYRLNEEIQKYKNLQNQFENNKKQGNQKLSSSLSNLQDFKSKLLQKEFQKKSLQQIVDVIKNDQIIYSKRKYDQEKILKHLQLKLKSIKQHMIIKNEEDNKVIKVYEKLVNKLSAQEKQRNQHLSSLTSRIIEKDQINNSNVLRKSQMGILAEQAMYQRGHEQKQWIGIFLTHKFLQKNLKSKIHRQMQKFSIVEQSFKQIKIATGVSNAQTFVNKFLSKQESYGNLLSKIAGNEREIQILKQQKAQLQKQIKQNQDLLDLLDINRNSNYNFRQQLKQADYYQQKRKKGQLQDQKLKEYLFRQQKKLVNFFNIDLQSNVQFIDFINKEQKIKKFKQHLNKINKLLDQSYQLNENQNQKQSKSLQKQQSNGINQDEMISKLFRIKPKIKIQQQSQIKQQQYIQAFEQEQIQNSNDQTKMMEEQRFNVIQANYKFMKQLKNKKQEAKKLIVQNLVKNNKQKTAPVVKKVQVLVEQ